MCQSRVATMWSQRPGVEAMSSVTADATAAPPSTASDPPSQKSFWTSTTINARLISPILVTRPRSGKGPVCDCAEFPVRRCRKARERLLPGFSCSF